MARHIVITALVLLTASTAAAFPVQVPGEHGHERSPFVLSQATEEREPGPATLEEAIEIAVEHYGGRATRSETVERDGRAVHEIRLLVDDTIVRTVRIDPDTGAIIPEAR